MTTNAIMMKGTHFKRGKYYFPHWLTSTEDDAKSIINVYKYAFNIGEENIDKCDAANSVAHEIKNKKSVYLCQLDYIDMVRINEGLNVKSFYAN